MSAGGAATVSDVRERIRAAALDELVHWGVDRFSIAAVADRGGLDPGEIRRQWADREALIRDVLVEGPRRQIVVPDTGSLRGDLRALARPGPGDLCDVPQGRQLQSAQLLTNPRLGAVDIRRQVRRCRVERLRVIFARARWRGELRGGVEPSEALELLLVPITMRVLFTGGQVDEPYCQTVDDMVWRAVAAVGPQPAGRSSTDLRRSVLHA